MKTLADYRALPWTVQGRWVTNEGGYYLITIAELPRFSVVGDTRAEAEAEFPAVLDDYLEACIESGFEPVEPAGYAAAS